MLNQVNTPPAPLQTTSDFRAKKELYRLVKIYMIVDSKATKI